MAGDEGPGATPPGELTIAVEGCGHGDLDDIYATIEEVQASAPRGPRGGVFLSLRRRLPGLSPPLASRLPRPPAGPPTPRPAPPPARSASTPSGGR